MHERQIVVCELGDGSYGLDIGLVYEIIRLQAITVVPQAPSFVDGVINLRGRIIPIVDLAARFGMERRQSTKASRIVVASCAGLRVGLIVDAVSEVLMLSEDSVEPTPGTVASAEDCQFLRGIAKLGDRLVILLDLEGLFGDRERLAIQSAA